MEPDGQINSISSLLGESGNVLKKNKIKKGSLRMYLMEHSKQFNFRIYLEQVSK